MNLAQVQPYRAGRADWAQAAAVALALFSLYAATAPRTVAMEDDGMFVLSSYFLGIEHPPGYPLFILLGKLATLLPFGSVAYRVHLLSGLFGALGGAALWLCARALIQRPLAAYLAALGVGLSPVYWSQALIAEVYTLNVFLLFVLAYLALTGGRLSAMALLFGLSLSNHWPLMLLVAPAFAVLLWPRRLEILQRLPLLAALLALGLLPYAWMVWLSWTGRAISFDGPLQSIGEVWHFVSRDGYAEVDDSPSAGWADRLRYFGFFGGELLRQFAVAGALVAAVGAVVQWRELGGRTAGFLSAAFLMPSVVLLLLLNFDYDALHKHVFHVYPLPAYGVAALWMGIGAAWLARHWSLGAAQARLGAFALLAAIAAVGCRGNLMWSYDWPARYAHAVLRSLPQGAAVFASGEPDLAPIAYFHMVEGMRPDITLYQPQGLILGNRLFHPLRTDASTAKAIVRAFIEQDPRPVAFTLGVPPGYAQRDRWLHVELDRTASDAATVTPELSEDAMRFAEDALLELRERNAYAAYVQGQLRRHYGRVLGRTLPVGGETEVRRRRHLDLLGRDFFGSLGVVEGILAQGPGAPLDQAVRYLQRARDLMPGDVGKSHQARYLELRAYVRLEAGDRAAALRDLRAALAVWPVSENTAIPPLEDLYRQAGDEQAVTAVRAGLRD